MPLRRPKHPKMTNWGPCCEASTACPCPQLDCYFVPSLAALSPLDCEGTKACCYYT